MVSRTVRGSSAAANSRALAADLELHLRTRWLGRHATVVESLPSTQDEARRLALAGAVAGTLVWAQAQTAGRGRSDRRWFSSAGNGLWFSIILRPPLPPDQAAFLGILAGVAVADALRRLSGADVRLKWPNDLLAGGGKVGGILAEAAMTTRATAWVVIGVGINLHPPAGGFDPSIAATARALDAFATREATSAARLAACLGSIERRYEQLLSDGPEATRRRWLRLAETIGRRVSADLGGRQVEGTATDLDPDGALVIATQAGLERVHAGEVVHLR